jgi:hypothetical protein
MRENMGSVSSGTMRAEDLIPAFIAELRWQKPLKREHRKLIREIEKAMKQEDYFDNDASDDLEALFNALDEYCLPYFYFGAHPGDGADYGYWLSDGFEDEFDGLKVNDTSEVPKGYTGEVLYVNDHGNCTLYAYSRGRSRKVWAIV